jgi:SanA protein
MRKFLNVLVFTMIAALVTILLLQFHVARVSRPHIHSEIQNIKPAYVGIVLGASVRPDKSLSPILKDRVDAAYLAYSNKKFKKFLLSGDHRSRNYDEVNAMKTYLNKKGVPNEDIFLDHAGFDTYNSMFRAKEIFEVNDMIIFTQEFHLPRAVYLAQNLGLDAQGYISDMQDYPANGRLTKREWLANIKAWIELNIDEKPVYSGKKIPVTGDSSPSHEKG